MSNDRDRGKENIVVKNEWLSSTPSSPVYKVWFNIARSSKLHFDYLFILYYNIYVINLKYI